MKVLLGLAVVIIIALVLVYQFGGFTTHDPEAQAAAFREQISPGMSWQEVADVRAPRRMMPFDVESPTGMRAERDFDADQLQQMLANGRFPDGFAFDYHFTAADAYQVVFDERGVVLDVRELATTQDLLEGRLFTP